MISYKSKIIYIFIVLAMALAGFGFSPNPASAAIYSVSPYGNRTGLVGAWTFDGKDMANGVARDVTGNGNNGNLTNIASSTFYAPGKIGQAGNFDGVNDRINMGNPSNIQFDITTPFSVSFWAKTVTSSSNQSYVNKTNNMHGLGWYIWQWTGDRKLYFTIGTSTDGTQVSSATSAKAINDNNWHHFVATYSGNSNGNGMKIYVDNGTPVTGTTKVFSGTFANADNLMVGNLSTGGAPSKGPMDDVRIYNRELSASEVFSLYKQGETKFASSPVPNPASGLGNGLVGYWTFDGKDISQNVSDISGNGNHGSLKLGSTGNVSTTTISGKIGQALVFDGGVDDYVLVPNTVLDGATDVTYSFWFKTISTQPQAIISGANASNNNEVLIFFGSDTNISIYSGNSVGHTINRTIPKKNDNKWHHFVAIRDQTNSQMGLYRDGVLVSPGLSATTTTAPSIDSGGLLFGQEQDSVGGGFDATQSLDGNLDDVRIYRRVLSASEVLSLYKQGETKFASSPVPKPASGLGSGLVGYWTFDGKDMLNGVVRDVSGTGNNGNPSGIASSTFYAPGKIGQAGNFDGFNDYVNIPYSSTFDFGANQDFTVSTWVKTTLPMVANVWPVIVSKEDGVATRQGYSLVLHNSNTDARWYFEIYVAGVGYGRLGASDIADGRWHLITGVRSGDTTYAYQDGVLASQSVASSGSVAKNSAINIGRVSGAAQGKFRGSTDDVRIYNRALSSTEVLQLYNQGR